MQLSSTSEVEVGRFGFHGLPIPDSFFQLLRSVRSKTIVIRSTFSFLILKNYHVGVHQESTQNFYILWPPPPLYGVVQKMSARLHELDPSTVASSHNLADIFWTTLYNIAAWLYYIIHASSLLLSLFQDPLRCVHTLWMPPNGKATTNYRKGDHRISENLATSSPTPPSSSP